MTGSDRMLIAETRYPTSSDRDSSASMHSAQISARRPEVSRRHARSLPMVAMHVDAEAVAIEPA